LNKTKSGYQKYRWIVPALILALEIGLMVFVATGGRAFPLFDSPVNIVGSCLIILWIIISIGVKVHSILVPEHQIARLILVAAIWIVMILYVMIFGLRLPVMADPYNLIRGLLVLFMPYIDQVACL